jgi:hypothetical protein
LDPLRTLNDNRDQSAVDRDMRHGQSLVVWQSFEALASLGRLRMRREGREAAHAVDKFLMGSAVLPR